MDKPETRKKETRKRETPIRETDEGARQLAKSLMRKARFGAIAVREPDTGYPFASRVAVATDIDGAPIILISQLSGHTRALEADHRCSLLLGEPGKGDPLAHPRISLTANARKVEPGSEEQARLRGRYLRRHPKAALYVDFADFSFYRLEVLQGSLNGGFGKAFELDANDVLLDADWLGELASQENAVVEHMNADHSDAVALYATVLCSAASGAWKLASIDPEGIDLVLNDAVARLSFPKPLEQPQDIRPTLVQLAKDARSRSGGENP
ncbi:MAG: HugZ family protein [Stappiaceae bacterium]